MLQERHRSGANGRVLEGVGETPSSQRDQQGCPVGDDTQTDP